MSQAIPPGTCGLELWGSEVATMGTHGSLPIPLGDGIMLSNAKYREALSEMERERVYLDNAASTRVA
ncbi:MAG: hypothetical protein ACE5LQ_04010, partial [Candidatus Bipolaricaulia bacterium]